MTPFSAADLKVQAHKLGFNMVGVTRAEPSPHLDAYLHWVDEGMHGAMGYLARPDRLDRRKDLNIIVPGVQSMVLVGVDYRVNLPESVLSDPSRGRIASYAWHLDYHDIITPRLELLAAWMTARTPMSHRVYVDTGAILERSHAYSAGMGFIGKNTMLIHPRRGSYFFLGEILTDLTFDEYDAPGLATMCGRCTRCLIACPTDAFPRPHVLDARRCISYHTIENKGYIDHALRPQFGNWVFGCDVCQDVCPWQRFTQTTMDAAYIPTDIDHAAPPLLDLLTLDDATFAARYEGTPLYRPKRARLVRNACIAAGNWGHPDAIAPLHALLMDESPIVRAHALWALVQIEGVTDQLRQIVRTESDPVARADMQTSIAGASAG